ncbi:phospholipase D alpha 1-like isoform X2 [Penaeus monodon]|uniref:phospholipase D alpha 1-like isoform X2 n=1 Tax=Penaeus monodon TaxID=6687 RepID=UPI0018A721AE|nr:phospholipase D alpha 1-like isoform X2 [Penaeus monodon]XP_037801149.1 phospholipase D alpha 1-like isoform X2 [Penaeus monodon]
MCLLCMLQYMGIEMGKGAAGACGGRQGEYALGNQEEQYGGSRHDWRYYLCCFSRSGAFAERGKMVFLHGVLYLEVIEGRDLPDVDTSWFRSSKDVSDPYVTVDTCCAGRKTCRIAKTSIIYNSLNPHWGEKFRIEMCHETESLLFTVKDLDLVKMESMGYMSIRAEDLLRDEPVTGWFPIMDKSGNPAGAINVSLRFLSTAEITRSNEVPDTVFPMRTGCRVKLYQDAHTPAEPPITDVPTRTGDAYEPPQLWVDITNAINNAQKLIYIIGWSVKTDISLVRDGECENLGDLLKRKASEGVRVMVMVWNEAMSTDIYTPGIMGTHDEETRLFFEGSEVEVFLAPRQKNKGKLMENNFVATLYTHHQKCVIVDAEAEGDDRRRLVAFAGGIDLTDGRYDTPDHPLYKTLPEQHQHDFYNGICQSSVTQGPREPWHDIHMYVEGRAANDILQNFVERWRRQAPDRENRLLPVTEDQFVLEWDSPDEMIWNVQFFRSINSDSAQFDSNVLDKLLTRKGRLYENSIQRAYVHHIRRAKRFIYIENQYFLGSAHSWLVHEAKCPHLIPIELTTRIINAINAGEDFRVYVVIPIHPEGDPTSTAVQEILHWQHRTMEMMYKKIAKAIRKAKIDAHPTDYLSFYCLGKRECPDDLPDGLDEPDSGTVAEKARENLRFMIYVHSKMAIFDDEYIIVGSANINERSMSGNRDSEMALGAYQPMYTKEECGDGEIEGDVRTFRLSLWAEHCGAHMEEHLTPTSVECMRAINEVAKTNLEKFISPEPEHNDSHLMSYPLDVNQDGRVLVREDLEKFPDTGGSITGKNSNFLPNSLTT